MTKSSTRNKFVGLLEELDHKRRFKYTEVDGYAYFKALARTQTENLDYLLWICSFKKYLFYKR